MADQCGEPQGLTTPSDPDLVASAADHADGGVDERVEVCPARAGPGAHGKAVQRRRSERVGRVGRQFSFPLHQVALRPYRMLGCFEPLADEYLGWMDTPRGRRTFVEFFTHYDVGKLPDLAAGLGHIACPTAVIWGNRDRYIPFATAQELAQRIPHSTLTRLSGGDHYIMEERAAEVTAALLGLLARPCVVSRAVQTD